MSIITAKQLHLSLKALFTVNCSGLSKELIRFIMTKPQCVWFLGGLYLNSIFTDLLDFALIERRQRLLPPKRIEGACVFDTAVHWMFLKQFDRPLSNTRSKIDTTVLDIEAACKNSYFFVLFEVPYITTGAFP